jgi:hypothetical protein
MGGIMLPIQGNLVNILQVNFGADKTWTEVATITAPEQTATLKGLKTTDMIIGVSKPTAQAGLGIVGWRVSAADTIAVTFVNPTVGGITPTAAEVYTAWIARKEHTKTDASA